MNYHRQRQDVRRRAAARPVPAHLPARARLVRRQEGMRRGRLRRLHGLARRQAGPQLPHPRLPRRGPRRSRPSRGWRTDGELHPMQQAFLDAQALPVRLLHRRHDHDGAPRSTRSAGGPAARAQGQPLPLHRLPRDRGRDPRRRVGRGGRRRAGLRREPAQPRRPRRSSPASARYTLDVAMEGMLHLKVLRSPHAARPHPRHRPRQGARRAGRRRGLHLGGRAAPALHHRHPRRLPRRSRRHLHARQRRPLRRPAGRRRRRRDRGRRGGGLPAARGRVRDPAGRLRPGGGHGAGRAGPPRQGRRGAAATSSSTSTARSATSRPASREADVVHEGTYSTSRVQHAHLETHGSIAWMGEDGRLHVRTSSQAPFIAKQKLVLPVRPLPAQRPRLLRARRRRVRRQAGDAHRGPVRAGHAEDRPAGEVGVHARGAVHRRDDAPPDDDARQARGQAGRHADRDPDPRRLQHRRLRRPRRRDARPPPSAARSPSTAARTRRSTATRSTPTWCRPAPSAATARRRRPSPSNARWTSWRSALGMDPFEMRRKNMIRPGDSMESIWKDPSDVEFGSYGLDQCLDLVEAALASGRGAAEARRGRLARGHGHRAGDARLRPADGAPLRGARCALLADGSYHLAVGSTEIGNGSVTVAPADRRRRARRRGRTASPSSTPTPTSRPTTPAPSPAPARWSPARRWRWPPRRCATTSSSFASRHTGAPLADLPPRGRRRRLRRHAGSRSPTSTRPARAAGHRFEAKRKAYLSPRTRRLQRPWLPHRRPSRHRRDPRSCRACTPPTSAGSSTRCSAAARSRARSPWASAGRSTRRWSSTSTGAMVNPALPQLPHPGLRRRPAQRGLLRRHLRHHRPARRQVAGRVRDQPGRAGDGQRARRRHRRPLRRPAASRPTASSTGSSAVPMTRADGRGTAKPRRLTARHRRHPDARAARVRRGVRRAGRRRPARVIAIVPGFIKQTVMPPSPPAQVDWVILQRFADRDEAAGLAALGSSGCERVEGVAPMLVGQDDVHLVTDGGAGVRRPRSRPSSRRGSSRAGGRLPPLGAADRRGAGEGAGLSGLPVRAADPGRAGRLAGHPALRLGGRSAGLARLAGAAGSCSTRRRASPRNSTPGSCGPASTSGSSGGARRARAAGLEAEHARAADALPGGLPVRRLGAGARADGSAWACRSGSPCSSATSPASCCSTGSCPGRAERFRWWLRPEGAEPRRTDMIGAGILVALYVVLIVLFSSVA